MSVLSLSLSGMGIETPPRLLGLPAGSPIRGTLHLEEEKYPLVLEVVYCSARMTGGRILEMTDELKARLLQYFIAEFAALQMTEVKGAVLASDVEGTPHFFIGRNQCELYFVEKDGKVIWFHLTFLGNYIEGGRDGRLKEGWFEDEERRAYKGATLIHSLRPLSREMGTVALKFLANVPVLAPSIREQLESFLESGISEGVPS